MKLSPWILFADIFVDEFSTREREVEKKVMKSWQNHIKRPWRWSFSCDNLLTKVHYLPSHKLFTSGLINTSHVYGNLHNKVYKSVAYMCMNKTIKLAQKIHLEHSQFCVCVCDRNDWKIDKFIIADCYHGN